MDKLSLFLRTLDCSYGIHNVCYDGNIVSFQTYITPQNHYEHILVKFGLQNDVRDMWSYQDCTNVISVNINRLLIDDVVDNMLSA